MAPILLVLSHPPDSEIKPFTSGYCHQLRKMLREVGMDESCYTLRYMFPNPTWGGKFWGACGPKAQAAKGVGAVAQGKYIRKEFEPQLDEFLQEVRDLDPNIIVACGVEVASVLTGEGKIDANRGVVTLGRTGHKVIPTYSPEDIIAKWEQRVITKFDLTKAFRNSGDKVLYRKPREIWVEPTLDDIEEFFELYVRGCDILSSDIETVGDIITCEGFSVGDSHAIVIPFYLERDISRNYWKNYRDEVRAWEWVRRYLAEPKRVLGQNYLYDTHLRWKKNGIVPGAPVEDTMLLHHALQPELKKSLGFQGSIYTDEMAWKGMRTATNKKED